MATGGESDELTKEFEAWLAASPDDSIFMLGKSVGTDGNVNLSFLLKGEHEFKLHCPASYPNYEGHFYVEAGPALNLWGNTLNEFLLDCPERLTLSQALNKALFLFALERSDSDQGEMDMDSEEEDMAGDDEEEEDHLAGGIVLSDDDAAFTTEWELQVARKKKRWAQKEEQVREEMKKKARLGPSTSDSSSMQGKDKDQAKQIFTSSAASGILTNDLVKIMEKEKEYGVTADPIDDNIYQWKVHLFNFDSECALGKDLEEVNKQFDYNHIELQLDFAIDLYPFYPPIVKVVRPRLQASMMQRVTNMEMLKLSYWNAAKDMLSVLIDIKQFLQTWARLEVNCERNDRKRYPMGSYVHIEHHLLKLALVSEVNPRANTKYQMDVNSAANMRSPNTQHKHKKKKDEYWAAGVGYGHHNRPEWDIKAYIAAQKEKDKQIESVLHQILVELKLLYANHAPQLKPRISRREGATVQNNHNTEKSEGIDPVEDMYNILEGSAIVPFVEQYLKADSFLEICRHTSVYKVIVDIIKEIALQNQLVPLLGVLSDQEKSVYSLLRGLENKANILLQHICKAGNGSIPKPLKKDNSHSGTGSSSKKVKDSCFPLVECIPAEVSTASVDSHMTPQTTAEEKLAREFQVLFRDVTVAFNRAGLDPLRTPETPPLAPSGEHEMEDQIQETEVMDINFSTDEEALETRYKQALLSQQFDTCDIDVEGSKSHHYSKEFKKQEALNQTQVFRIAQELTSLSSSLPLDLSSSILVRTDDEKLTLMRALITGPHGTPYSGGCYLFDIFFPSSYPHVPPLVNLQTTGGGTVRFNPNLYNCGKVCLSLLGTWEGQQGEQWNETASTVLQVLVSIQSLILVPEPYFNEPGYEQEIGTEAGTRHSNEYNTDVRVNSIKHAMIGQLQSPSQGFEEAVRTHFYLKKDAILQEVEGWVRCSKSSRLERAFQNLKAELLKLPKPPNLANLSNTPPGANTTITQPEIHNVDNTA